MEKFEMKKGQILLIEKQHNQYLILWQTNSSIQHWPHGDNKIILPVANSMGIIRLLSLLSNMFGVEFKRRENPNYECVFEII